MTPVPIILDCDPGHDDAIAILLALASPEIELVGITTVSGNQTLDKTTANALRVLEFVGRATSRSPRRRPPLVRERDRRGARARRDRLDGPTCRRRGRAGRRARGRLIADEIRARDGGSRSSRPGR
jgi:inosine-uridine nucleoside N-ribohydrolase